MKLFYRYRVFISLALLLVFFSGTSLIHAKSLGLAEGIEYRGGNGMHSPDGKWYAEVLDGHFDEKAMMYFRFKLYNGDFEGKTVPKDVIPDVDLIVPCNGINVRSMNLSWSSNGEIFFAEYVSVTDTIGFSYDRSKHTFEMDRVKKVK